MRALGGIVVVTNEPGAIAPALAAGADVVPDEQDAGQSPAAAAGVARAWERGAERVLLVPGDCPALEPAEVEELLAERVEAPAVTIVSDRHGTGTNALLLAPPRAIAPAFGEGSFARHSAAAEAAGAVAVESRRRCFSTSTLAATWRLCEPCSRAHGPRLRTRRRAGRVGGRSPVTWRLLGGLAGGLPEVRAGRRPGGAARRSGGRIGLRDGDVLSVAHKVVSKVEGRVRRLGDVEPGERAGEAAGTAGPAPRPGGARRGAEVLRDERVLVCRTRHGFVCANAGVDASNAGEPGAVVLLPLDPDASARALRAGLREHAGVGPAVLVTDSFGRAWRHGQSEVAIGCAGLAPLDDWRGRADRDGRELAATWIAVADEAAAAADLSRSQGSGEPAVVVRGLERFVTARRRARGGGTGRPPGGRFLPVTARPRGSP